MSFQITRVISSPSISTRSSHPGFLPIHAPPNAVRAMFCCFLSIILGWAWQVSIYYINATNSSRPGPWFRGGCSVHNLLHALAGGLLGLDLLQSVLVGGSHALLVDVGDLDPRSYRRC